LRVESSSLRSSAGGRELKIEAARKPPQVVEAFFVFLRKAIKEESPHAIVEASFVIVKCKVSVFYLFTFSLF